MLSRNRMQDTGYKLQDTRYLKPETINFIKKREEFIISKINIFSCVCPDNTTFYNISKLRKVYCNSKKNLYISTNVMLLIMKSFIIFFAMILLPGLMQSQTIAGGNPGFESDFSGWTRLINWGAGTTHISISTSNPQSGSKAAFFDAGPTYYEQLYADITGLTISTKYTLSFYAAGEEADFYVGPTSNVYEGTYYYVDCGSSGLTYYLQVVGFTATATTMRIWFDFYPAMDMYVDNFVITETPVWEGTTNTDWATGTNWSTGTEPGSSDYIVSVPNTTNDPIISTTVSVYEISIESGADFTIAYNGNLTSLNSFTNAGTFTIKSTSSGTGSVIIEGSATGDVTVERFLTHDRWHYIAGQSNISGNFSTLSMGLTGGVNNDQFYRWDESLDWGGNIGNWVDILNGPNGNDPTMATEGFLACKGYAINYITTDKTLSLSGAPYTVDKSINLTKTTGSLNEGCNLVGNPFTSTLAVNTDAETTNNFLTQNTDVLDASYVAVYLWNEQAGWTYPDNNDYVTINNSSGATYIQAGQAFMVVAKTNGASLSFPAAIRKHGSASFYKNQVNDEVSRFELGVFNPEGQTNSVLIAFIPEMTNGLDPSYDAGKMSGNASLSLYTKLVEDNGHNFAIQALPPLDGTTSVKLGLRAELTGTYKFEPVNVENFNESVSIKLEDKQTGAMIDLTTIPEYSFGINEAGTFDDRFVLHFKGAVGIEEVLESNKIRFYVYDNKLYIIDKELKNATIQLFNMLGQPVMKKQYSQAVNAIDLNLSKGYYIVRIITDKMYVSGKIYVE